MRALYRMTTWLGIAALLAMLALPAGLACDRQEGPMEEAGEAVDDAADELEDEADDLSE